MEYVIYMQANKNAYTILVA